MKNGVTDVVLIPGHAGGYPGAGYKKRSTGEVTTGTEAEFATWGEIRFLDN